MRSGGWSKKSKPAMEERVAVASTIVEEGSNNPDDICSDAVRDGLVIVDFDGNGDKLKGVNFWRGR